MKLRVDTEQDQIRQYLLGIRPVEAESFEDRLVSDDDFYLTVQLEQELLIDDYVAGRLGSKDAERFRHLCQLSSSLREKVSDLRLLQSALADDMPSRFAPRQQTRSGHAVLLYSLALLVCCAIVWFAFGHSRSQAISSQSVSATLSSESSPTNPRPKVDATFFLASDKTRGPSQVRHLTMAAGTESVNLQIQLGNEDSRSPVWDIDLMQGVNRIAIRNGMHSQQEGLVTFLPLDLPASVLPDGIYALHLAPSNSSGRHIIREFRLQRNR